MRSDGSGAGSPSLPTAGPIDRPTAVGWRARADANTRSTNANPRRNPHARSACANARRHANTRSTDTRCRPKHHTWSGDAAGWDADIRAVDGRLSATADGARSGDEQCRDNGCAELHLGHSLGSENNKVMPFLTNATTVR
jgi:hypothetical protein